ncbi:hypothetical protein ACFDR9_004507 [Janthinobacterium sp. CG_23.3]|uniref:hypothetical protein n=1 Tax=Janthinobacterium sp. CG_23.3 TaxID=3349634 RepID=UPI0038D36AF5
MATVLENFYLTLANRRRITDDDPVPKSMPITLSRTVAIGRDKDPEKYRGQDGGNELLQGIIDNFAVTGDSAQFDGMLPQTLTGYLVETRQKFKPNLNNRWVEFIISSRADWLFIFHPEINNAFKGVKEGSKIDMESFDKAYKGDKGAPTYEETTLFIKGGFDTVERAESDKTELSRNRRR